MSTPTLVVNTDSWHYNFYRRIRCFYGVKTEPKQTSLCPYVQTMIWGSVLFVFSLPIQIIGWMVLRGLRWMYRLCEFSGHAGFVDFVDMTPAGTALRRSSRDLEANPFLTLLAWGMGTVMISLVVGMMIFLVGVLVGGFVISLPHIPGLFKQAVGLLGWSGVVLGWMIGWASVKTVSGIYTLACYVGSFLVWLFTTSWFWLLILDLIAWTVVSVAASFILCWLCLQLLTSKPFRKLLDFLLLHFNGYHEAYTAAQQRRVEESRLAEETDIVEVVNQKPTFLARINRWYRCRLSDIDDFFADRVVNVGNIAVTILSPIGVMKNFFWAVKHQACPIVTFATVEELRGKSEEASKSESSVQERSIETETVVEEVSEQETDATSVTETTVEDTPIKE